MIISSKLLSAALKMFELIKLTFVTPNPELSVSLWDGKLNEKGHG